MLVARVKFRRSQIRDVRVAAYETLSPIYKLKRIWEAETREFPLVWDVYAR